MTSIKGDIQMGRHQTNLVFLTKEDRAFLAEHIKKGKWSPREVRRAKILLLADINGENPLHDEAIAKKLDCSLSSVSYRRKRFSQTRCIEDTLFDNPRTGRPTIIDGAVDAHMTAIACSHPPKGEARWTLRLIKDRLVELEIIDAISHTTVGRILKKKKSSPG